MKIFVVMLFLSLAAAKEGLLGKRPVDRRLFLALNRNQKFYRQEDRQRCRLTSPGRNEPHHE